MVNYMNAKLPAILCFYELLVLFASLILETDNGHVNKHTYWQLLVSSPGKEEGAQMKLGTKIHLLALKGPSKGLVQTLAFNQESS